MDARYRRSQSALRAAVLELAGAAPIAEISVAELCRVAGVTRDTFYRHADSPTRLLADTLGDELEAAVASVPETSAIGDAERVLLTHVQERAVAYRSALGPVLAAPVRERIERVFQAGLAAHLATHPEILPPPLRHDPAAAAIAVAYAAAGTVGAIETWLAAGADDVERAVDVILAASPEWWLR